jgi:hypothetical protein
MAKFTADDVATWMLEKVTSDGELEQALAADEIESRFGQRFVYEGASGWRIHQDVLQKFLARSKTTIVWHKGEKTWRLRDPGDEPGRQQI